MKFQPCRMPRTGLKVSVVGGWVVVVMVVVVGGGAKSFSCQTQLFAVRLGCVEVELGL